APQRRGPISRRQHAPAGARGGPLPPQRRCRGGHPHPGAGLRLPGGHRVGTAGPPGDEDRPRTPGQPPVGRARAVRMSSQRILVLKDRYVDSVVQMGASRAMMEVEGVEWAAAAMGTPANLKTLAERGFDLDGLDLS